MIELGQSGFPIELTIHSFNSNQISYWPNFWQGLNLLENILIMSCNTIAIIVTKMVMNIDLWPRQAFFPSYSPKRCLGPSKIKVSNLWANQDIPIYIYQNYFMFCTIICILNSLTVDNLYQYLYHSRDTGYKFGYMHF